MNKWVMDPSGNPVIWPLLKDRGREVLKQVALLFYICKEYVRREN